jgi:hypothetical protein
MVSTIPGRRDDGTGGKRSDKGTDGKRNYEHNNPEPHKINACGLPQHGFHYFGPPQKELYLDGVPKPDEGTATYI